MTNSSLTTRVLQILSEVKLCSSETLESETVEFKNFQSEGSLHNSKELAEEISALANTRGGLIIIGVIDNPDEIGRDWIRQLNGFENVDLWTTKERLLGKINPKISLKLHSIQFEEKKYLVIEVPKHKSSVVSTSSGKTCIREGKSSRPAFPSEIETLVKSLTLYDWSHEELDLRLEDVLNETAVNESNEDFCRRRGIDKLLETNVYLESIGATRNGTLNKGGLLFLGKKEAIKEFLGAYEYRFSWKTKSGQLVVNQVWEDCLWETIKKAKRHFNKCNSKTEIVYNKKTYELTILDEIAFHEAFLNALVHRDYSHDGMVSVNFGGGKIVISNPGKFYGGVSSENIVFHEPRHRNKGLARILMVFQLVDRAGMGVPRMGIRSLMYGRAFPTFREIEDFIEVSMDAEFLRPGIFVITQGKPEKFGVAELIILNTLFEKGFVDVREIEKKLNKFVPYPFETIIECLEQTDFSEFVEFVGSKKGLFLSVKDHYKFSLECSKKTFKISKTSQKHIELYKYLKRNSSAGNDEIMTLLGIKYSSQTSAFLKSTEYSIRKGSGPSSQWFLKKD